MRQWMVAIGVLTVIGALAHRNLDQSVTLMYMEITHAEMERIATALEAYQRTPCSLNPSVALTFEKDDDGRENVYWIDGRWKFECRFVEAYQRSLLFHVR